MATAAILVQHFLRFLTLLRRCVAVLNGDLDGAIELHVVAPGQCWLRRVARLVHLAITSIGSVQQGCVLRSEKVFASGACAASSASTLGDVVVLFKEDL